MEDKLKTLEKRETALWIWVVALFAGLLVVVFALGAQADDMMDHAPRTLDVEMGWCQYDGEGRLESGDPESYCAPVLENSDAANAERLQRIEKMLCLQRPQIAEDYCKRWSGDARAWGSDGNGRMYNCAEFAAAFAGCD